jgi:hypothetical protein
MDQSRVRDEVVAMLSLMSLAMQRDEIGDGTELYYDLHIYGDDMFEFLQWLRQTFKVKLDVNIMKYGPREGMEPILFRKARQRRQRARQQFKSLTVGDILRAVEVGGLSSED